MAVPAQISLGSHDVAIYPSRDAQMTKPLPASPADLAQRSADFTWDANPLQLGIALALSGGGFRAMLRRDLREPSPPLGRALGAGSRGRRGAGSFAQFKAQYVDKILEFSRTKIDVGDVLTGLLPWTSAAAQVEASYDKLLFNGFKLSAMADQPQFIFSSTNMQTGVNFRFSKLYAGDYIMGRLANPDLPLSTAVTASSAFPPFLSPLVLQLPAGSFTDWPGQSTVGRPTIDPAPFRSKVFLTDGGVYDNHGLEPIVKRYMTLLVSDGGAPFLRTSDVATDPIRQLEHVFDITDNQVRSLRRRDLVARYQLAVAIKLKPNQTHPDARLGSYWGIDTDPTNVAPAGSLPCTVDNARALAGLATRLSDLGEAPSKQLINWDYAICDRCIRKYYVVNQQLSPAWPYPDQPLG
jgi:NTE family protein